MRESANRQTPQTSGLGSQNLTPRAQQLPQDLHIHTAFSSGDSAVAPEQTVELVSAIAHARIVGISDHLEFLSDPGFATYAETVRSHHLYVGVEVSSARWVDAALDIDVDYYVYHCADARSEYRGAERLLKTGKPVIVAHPLMMGTDLKKTPRECLVEISNRYVWRFDWRSRLAPFSSRFRFVMSSDAHQPSWLSQSVARYVASQLGIEETLLFPPNIPSPG